MNEWKSRWKLGTQTLHFCPIKEKYRKRGIKVKPRRLGASISWTNSCLLKASPSITNLNAGIRQQLLVSKPPNQGKDRYIILSRWNEVATAKVIDYKEPLHLAIILHHWNIITNAVRLANGSLNRNGHLELSMARSREGIRGNVVIKPGLCFEINMLNQRCYQMK